MCVCVCVCVCVCIKEDICLILKKIYKLAEVLVNMSAEELVYKMIAQFFINKSYPVEDLDRSML